jgi:hypothetical protein
MWVFKCGYAAAYGHSFCVLYCAERHVDMSIVWYYPFSESRQVVLFPGPRENYTKCKGSTTKIRTRHLLHTQPTTTNAPIAATEGLPRLSVCPPVSSLPHKTIHLHETCGANTTFTAFTSSNWPSQHRRHRMIAQLASSIRRDVQ